MKTRFFIVFLGMLLALNSCDTSVIYEENVKIKNAAWDRNEKAFFEFEVNDSLAVYDLSINFRHGGDYPYRNAYIFTKTVSPSGKIARDTAQMPLADTKGRWLGKGIGDIFDYQFRFKQGAVFPENGSYYFEIEQAMRDETLENVTDVGIAIKKLNL